MCEVEHHNVRLERADLGDRFGSVGRLAAHLPARVALRAPRAVRGGTISWSSAISIRVMANQPFLISRRELCRSVPRYRRDGNDTGAVVIGRGAGQTRWESGLD